MYLPGFKAIAGALHTSVTDVALSLSSFFIGVSVAQLIYGPLLDRFGRKRPLYAGLVLYIISSIACVMAGTLRNTGCAALCTGTRRLCCCRSRQRHGA